jgi:hypothetical protein
MGDDVVASSAISCGTRRRVIASVDIPSADSWRMSFPVRSVIGVSVPRVRGIVVLRLWGGAGGVLLSVRRQKCFLMGHVTEVDVCPCAAL